MKTIKYRSVGSGGFSLIELMTVIGIIAILAAIAIPSYVGYNLRSKISEAYGVVAPIQHSFAEAFLQTGSISQAAAASNIDAAGLQSKYVSSISVESSTGEITITLRDANLGTGVTNPTLVLKPQQINSGGAYVVPTAGLNSPIDWSCVSTTSTTAAATTPVMLAPAVLGTLPSKYAPQQCK